MNCQRGDRFGHPFRYHILTPSALLIPAPEIPSKKMKKLKMKY